MTGVHLHLVEIRMIHVVHLVSVSMMLQSEYSKTCRQRPLSSETTSHERLQFGCTNSFSSLFNLTSKTTAVLYETKGHFFMATSACFTY